MSRSPLSPADEVIAGPLPPGRHRLARKDVLASQRGRLIDALAETVAEKGYAAATIADIVASAQVSRRTFYEHFASKEECFLAAYDLGTELMLAAIAEATAGLEDWRERAVAAMGAYLDLLAVEHAFARTMMLEVMAAGEAALARRRALDAKVANLYARLYAEARSQDPSVPELPAQTFDAIVGGIDAVVTECVRTGGHDALPQLVEPLSHFVLSNLGGPAATQGATWI